MADPVRLFEVEVENEPPAPAPTPKRDHGVATHMMLLALKSLSQRAVIALEALFSLLTVSLVFWAAYPILTTAPTTNQLIGLASFSIFILISNYLVLRRRG